MVPLVLLEVVEVLEADFLELGVLEVVEEHEANGELDVISGEVEAEQIEDIVVHDKTDDALPVELVIPCSNWGGSKVQKSYEERIKKTIKMDTVKGLFLGRKINSESPNSNGGMESYR